MLPPLAGLSPFSRLASLMQHPPTMSDEMREVLEASEYQLIETMVKHGCWTGPVPPVPATAAYREPSVSVIPFYLHNPPATLLAAIESLPKLVQDLARVALATLRGRHTPQLDAQNYQNLIERIEQSGAIIGDDGTIYGFGRYEALDLGWFWSFLNHLYTERVGLRPYNVAPPAPIPLAGRDPDRVRIALVSDWGTGPYPLGRDAQGPAVDVMEQLTTLKPDYVVHLGDVYYSGTPNITDLENLFYFPWHEEQDNLLNYWPTTADLPAGHSFTLNSNHEMYAGAEGYFDVALADPRFAAQAQSSIFALEYAGWTILGLDSAYFDPSPLDMTGSLGGKANPQQADWIRGLNRDPGRCIVLTHHAPVTYDGTGLETYDQGGETYGIWPELTGPEALGAAPAAWYFGHLHNGIIYNPTTNATQSPCRLRCLGNGALPYAKAPGLMSDPDHAIAYYYQTLNPDDPDQIRIYNGFVLLTIDRGGGVTEEFYQQGPPNGAPTVVFQQSYRLPG